MTGSWLATTVLALYYLVLGVLSLYGMHRMVLVVLYLRGRRAAAAPVPPAETAWPRVTVQLPLYNEMYVAQRLIEAVCRFDYPRDRLEVQVLDDSTDETTSLVADVVARYRELGFDIQHLHRSDRTGFKAGALAAGAEVARGELIAVFDADFVPDPDFLRRAVPWFTEGEAEADSEADPESDPETGPGTGPATGPRGPRGPRIGMVQGRWEHLNRDYSLLTRVQAILLDGHFVVEHTARHASGCFFNFNGTAGVWRREVIADAGGWQHDTLTEDLDLSYRAQLAGWKFVYLPELTVPSELPVDVNGFKSQQFRWAKGSIQTARKLLGRILAAPLPLRVKVEAFIHLTNNASYVLMVVLSLLLPLAMLIRRGQGVALLLAVDLPLFLAATASVVVFYIASQAGAGRRWWRDLVYVPALMAVGIGLSVSNARAVISGWRHRGGTFERTPKYRIEHRGEDWLGKRYRAGRSLAVVGEGLLAAYLGVAFVHAAWLELWASLPFLYLFLQGYLFVFLLSVLPGGGRRGWWRRRRAPRVQPARLP